MEQTPKQTSIGFGGFALMLGAVVGGSAAAFLVLYGLNALFAG